VRVAEQRSERRRFRRGLSELCAPMFAFVTNTFSRSEFRSRLRSRVAQGIFVAALSRQKRRTRVAFSLVPFFWRSRGTSRRATPGFVNESLTINTCGANRFAQCALRALIVGWAKRSVPTRISQCILWARVALPTLSFYFCRLTDQLKSRRAP
jgi:hypothetical protein